MPVENWDEIRTAFQVARLGTVSGAAEYLGVHHATVIRHVDALEARLGVKLFQRHARGYTPTEAGADLLQVAQATDDQFTQLVGRIKGHGDGVSGELVVTALASMSDMLVPALTEFQQDHPGLVIRLLTDSRLFRLEYGEAHVAIRAGAAPQDPDNVVQPFLTLTPGLYAARAYVDRMGLPKGPEDFGAHHFVGPDEAQSRAPFFRWLQANVPPDRIIFRGSDERAIAAAVESGAGIGFVTRRAASGNPDLVEVLPRQSDWNAPLWLVTHVDLHRTSKVQALLSFLKGKAKEWQSTV
ncbi:MAG: LysR family transcriptional regulator [Rhodobacteraceae bacterium]|nr:LysR family transcriptional regulator [Paracoccaceae bacterium]